MPMNRWIWLILAAVVLVAIGLFVWPIANRTTEAPPVAQAPAAAPPVQPATKDAGAGSAAQTSQQKSAPAPVVQTAEKETAPAPAQEPAAPAAEKETAPVPAQEPAAAPAAQTAEKETAPADNDADQHANDKATAELAALQPGFVPKELVTALNHSVVNFPSDSAEVPASMTDFLQKAAEDLKQLPNGHVVEIAGYTDNTGDQVLNVTLSQKRAEAVRQMLVEFGADPEMLIAKGYGIADPVASNDTPEGRRRNRRIEYHIVKAP
jgi:outer membrane protein OmpA-like peptidoglycan-associated protein